MNQWLKQRHALRGIKRFKFLVQMFCLCHAAMLFGQTGSIRGRVIDQSNLRPLMGVNVMLAKTSYGASTDSDGNYVIENVPVVVYQLAFTYIGSEKKIKPNVVVKKFGESSVDLQLRVWINDARQRMKTISYITDKVKAVFDEEGVEIPYPKRDIYVHQVEKG